MASRDFKEKLTSSLFCHVSSRYSGPPIKYDVTNVYPPLSPAACSVIYKYEL